MKLKTSSITTVAVLLSTGSLFAQISGTSHPEALNDPMVTSTPQTTAHYTKPSPAIPLTTATATVSVTTPAVPEPALHTRTVSPDAVAVGDPLPATPPTQGQYYGQPQMVAAAPARPLVPHEEGYIVTDDVNSGVVTDVPWRENEMPEGTVLRARLETAISTDSTPLGTAFEARLTYPVEHNGRIILPIGTIVSGRVTDLHGGRRIGGAALIHLEPEMITLPDGSRRRLAAQVVDLTHSNGSRVNAEGTILGNDHSKGTAAALGLTTASAAVAGAVVGGGVGAVVGAGIGAGVGTIWWLKRESHQTLEPGTGIVFATNRPLMLENVIQ